MNQICTNEIGGYRCDCKIGFTLDPMTNGCEGKINFKKIIIYNLFVVMVLCVGKNWFYSLNPLFFTDLNECQINNHECLDNQRCDNTIGSYRCIRLQSCGTGYTFNAETGHCDGRF